MRGWLRTGLVVGLATAMSVCATAGTAMAEEPRAVRTFTPGHGPVNVPLEVVGDVALELSSVISPSAARQALARHAATLGADAVVEVATEIIETQTTLNGVAGLPVAVMGGLVSLMRLDVRPLQETLDLSNHFPIKRKVRVVRGRAVKFVR